jgi:integrase/recombinase XerD
MIAERAGLKKDFWPYLLRHSQLTSMADKLTEVKLSLFGGWVLGTRMTRTYVHWSGRDLGRSILSLHGLAPTESSNHILTLTTCPRCDGKNLPSLTTSTRSCG